MLRSTEVALGKDRAAAPQWIHWIVTGALVAGVLAFDLLHPFGLSLSIFYFLPAVYAAWAVRGPAKWLFFVILLVALFLIPILSNPNPISISRMRNRAYGVVVGVFVLYLIAERHRLVATLQLANQDLEERVAVRTAELQKANVRFCQEAEDRKRAMEALVDSERRFRDLFESSRDAIFVEDSDGNVRDVNPAACRLHGLSREQLLSKNVRDLVPQRYSAESDRDFVRLFNGELTQIDGFSQRADGMVVPVELSASRLTYCGQPSLLLSVRDVTERRRTAEELAASRARLEVMSRQLIAAQESERRHLARELHDEIGQALTGIKLNLKALHKSELTPKSTTLVNDMIEVIDQTLQQARNLALDLRPSMLDDIGLVAALRWCLDRQSQRAGFIPEFVAETSVSGASPEINTACFRVAQECLTNIARHAQAHHVCVEVRRLDQELELLVRDDGIGFDVQAARDRARFGVSFGLLGMQERVQLVGGRFEIESFSSGGTTVRARFPMTTDQRLTNDQ